MILKHFREKNFFCYAILLSLVPLYLHWGNYKLLSLFIFFLLIVDLISRIYELHLSIASRSANRFFFYSFFAFFISTLIAFAFIRSQPIHRGVFYSDSLFNSALLEQMTAGLGFQSIFGLNGKTDYYLGAFSSLSSLTFFSNHDAYSSMVRIIVPYLITALSLSLLNLIFKVLNAAKVSHFLFVYIFSFFSNGNFFLQPNIDDRLLAILPVVSLTQSFGLIIFFEFAGNTLSRSNMRKMRMSDLVNKVILPVFCLLLVKPSMVPVAILLIAINHNLINDLKRMSFSFFLIALLCYLLTLYGNGVVIFEPRVPSIFSDSLLLGLCFSSFFFYLHLSRKVERFDWLIPAYLLLQLLFHVFNFYGAESWFADPLRILILIRMFSFFTTSFLIDSRRKKGVLRTLPLIVILFYVVETFLEMFFGAQILLKLLLIFLFVCLFVLANVFDSHKQVKHCSEIFSESSQNRDSAIRLLSRKFAPLLSFFLLFSSFNPLLVVESLGQVKQAKNAEGISLSEEDFNELIEIRRLVMGSGVKDTAVGFSNFVCNGDREIKLEVQLSSCDSRTFVLSGIIGLRSPLEGWLFPVWISSETKRLYVQTALDFQTSLNNWPLMVNWLSSYSDAVIPRVDTYFFLVDRYAMINDIANHAQEIYFGKRFSLYRFTLSKT